MRLARQWSLQGPPLIPSPEDVAIVARVARTWSEEHPRRAPEALLLGLTRELATMDWPTGTRLVAVDRSEGAIGALWRRDGTPPGSTARLGDWRALELADASVDLVVGDGALTVVAYPGDYGPLARELRRVMRPAGRCALRSFTRPSRPETVDGVGRALQAGRVRGFHALRWRVAMAAADASHNVRVRDAWRAFQDVCPEPRATCERFGWNPSWLATVDAWRDGEATYAFPPLEQVRAALRDDFVELACHVPGYELGERCPTLVLAPRPPVDVT